MSRRHRYVAVAYAAVGIALGSIVTAGLAPLVARLVHETPVEVPFRRQMHRARKIPA